MPLTWCLGAHSAQAPQTGSMFSEGDMYGSSGCIQGLITAIKKVSSSSEMRSQKNIYSGSESQLDESPCASNHTDDSERYYTYSIRMPKVINPCITFDLLCTLTRNFAIVTSLPTILFIEGSRFVKAAIFFAALGTGGVHVWVWVVPGTTKPVIFR